MEERGRGIVNSFWFQVYKVHQVCQVASLSSLVVPWALLLLLAITAVLLFKKKWIAAGVLTVVIVAMNWWYDCFCFGFKNNFTGDLKVLSFNVNAVEGYDDDKANAIFGIIQEEAPDVVFMTENYYPFCDSLHKRLHENYPYDTRQMAFDAIYSKFPLRKLLLFKQNDRGASYMVKSEAEVKGMTVTLFGCHLSSNNFSSVGDYLTPDEVKSASGIKAYFENFSYATELREMEADTVITHCKGAERVVIMGDLNEVSGGSSMRMLERAGYKDSWSKGGFGYGATIHHPLPYRIDHVLYNSGLKLKGIKKIDAEGISDHDALVAVFDLE